MPADRNELESLDRVRLVERARTTGIERPEVLTRLELIDEILSAAIADDQERRVARGLLGRARDLVARVVEKGLNLPDAAQKLRTLAPPLSAWRRGPAPIATVSLAEIYAGQGHDKLALKVLDEVLDREPDHAYAHKLRDKFLRSDHAPEQEPASLSSPRMPAPRKPASALNVPSFDPTAVRKATAALMPVDDGIAPTACLGSEPIAPVLHDKLEGSRFDTQQNDSSPPLTPIVSTTSQLPEVPLDDGVQLHVEHGRVLVRWRLRPRCFARARCARPNGKLAIRLLYFVPSWDGPSSSVQDVAVDALKGRLTRNLPDDAAGLCVALGWLTPEGFTALATAAEP
jgi:hypothetical protein